MSLACVYTLLHNSFISVCQNPGVYVNPGDSLIHVTYSIYIYILYGIYRQRCIWQIYCLRPRSEELRSRYTPSHKWGVYRTANFWTASFRWLRSSMVLIIYTIYCTGVATFFYLDDSKFKGWCIRSQHGIAWYTQQVQGEAEEARERVRKIQDVEDAWHVQIYSVLSLINNELRTDKECMTSDKVFEMGWFGGLVFDRSWVWWECDIEPAVQLCLVHHNPEPCPTVWAR